MENKKHKYFGTDGFRGEANRELTAERAFRVGRFLGWYFKKERAESENRVRIVIGKDTRRSSYMLEYALASGVVSSGADAYMLHVSSTPSVSYVTRQEGFSCGVMITASHNPFYDNGIKIINQNGEKMEDDVISLVEAYIDGDLGVLGLSEDLPLASREEIGGIIDHSAGRNRYIGYLISLASHSYKRLKVGLDAANGAVWMSAAAVFGALGAEVYTIGDEPDGENINLECGATDLKKLKALVKEQGLDVGFAFDGDADRCIAVDEKGEVVDGDGILYILAKSLSAQGKLNKNTVVTTVMSNGGLYASLEKLGISSVQTDVGDRFVWENMQKNDYSLGGEHSGHIIIKKYATTGDGLLTAIVLTEVICESKKALSELVRGMQSYPRCTENIRVLDKDLVLKDPELQSTLKSISEEISGKGRVLLRKSGTEPVIRIMAECESESLCYEVVDRIERAVLRAQGI